MTEYLYIEEYPILLKVKILHQTENSLIARSMDDESFKFLNDYRTRLYNLSQFEILKYERDNLYGDIDNSIIHMPQIIEGEYMNFIYSCNDEFCFEGNIVKQSVVSENLIKMIRRDNNLDSILL
jgi:hypothetical protein